MGIRELVFGRPIATEDADDERVSSFAGVPILGLDALASAAYGPEALLTVLLPLGRPALHYLTLLTPITVAVLVIVFISYRQTLSGYPNGGGAYTVCKENLGRAPSLLAAATLSLDYVLNVAVAIAAGVGALVSVVPTLLPYTLWLCLAVLLLLTLLNLRGVRSTGLAFMVPAFLFIACMLALIFVGALVSIRAGFHPHPVVAPPAAPATTQTVSAVLLLRAFANGCSALTGVEAVSNGVPIFKAPSVRNARRALTMIVTVLVVLLLGEALLCQVYGVVATTPGQPGFQSVLSMLTAAVFGRGAFYRTIMTAVVLVLMLSANTSFADFPRLCRVLASDGFLPEPLVHRGRRLEFSYGVLLLSVLSGVLLLVFDGITDRLIPLFAIGALAAFTMSRVGMVEHWRKARARRARFSLALNALGALATAVTLCVVLFAKFTEGAWISLVIVAVMVILLRQIRAHYDAIEAGTEVPFSCALSPPRPPLVVLPLRRWDAVALKALRFALRLSTDVVCVQVLTQDRDLEDLSERWQELVERPAEEHRFAAPRLVVLRSSYRDLFGPLLKFIHQLAADDRDRQIAVVVPELVEPRWYHYLLHNLTPAMLKRALLRHGGPQVMVVSAPWHLDAANSERELLAP